ncbi:MAG TPA: hypothetical protein PKJ33_00310 [Alphaproteobacteria bacterium]|nr:hypothetical protein [Alphaproteobacteria bacterium]
MLANVTYENGLNECKPGNNICSILHKPNPDIEKFINDVDRSGSCTNKSRIEYFLNKVDFGSYILVRCVKKDKIVLMTHEEIKKIPGNENLDTLSIDFLNKSESDRGDFKRLLSCRKIIDNIMQNPPNECTKLAYKELGLRVDRRLIELKNNLIKCDYSK